jgi:hypothetical protein
MNKLIVIVTFILFGIIYTHQIGSIANYVYTYESSIKNFSITTITFDNTSSSCNACICAALMSAIDYVAINCYKDNNTCLLFTSMVDITGIASSYNNFLYILSNISIPVNNANSSINSSSPTTTTLTSTTSSSTAKFSSTPNYKQGLPLQ